MKKIYKYQIPVKEKFTIALPKGATILRVDDVDGLFYLWAIVETDESCPAEIRQIECYKTGQELPNYPLIYLGFCKLFIAQELCLYIFEKPMP